MPDPLATDLGGIALRNPVLLAAGTAGVLDEMSGVLDLARVGGLVTKSITPDPRDGNPAPRMVPDRVGMLNAVGLANPGIERFAADIAPRAAGVPTVVIGSAAAFTIDGYVRVCATMDECEHIRAVELNVSCPNVHGGLEFGSDPATLRGLVRAVRPALPNTRLIVKLPPSIGAPGIVELARAAIDPGGEPDGPNTRPGADALTIANTLPAMSIDVRTRRPRLGNSTGGLSGPAIHPVAVALVRRAYTGVARDSGTPIVGVGGVMGWRDAAEFVLAGAAAVQVGTALFADPRTPLRVAKGLARWAHAQGVTQIGDLVGRVSPIG